MRAQVLNRQQAEECAPRPGLRDNLHQHAWRLPGRLAGRGRDAVLRLRFHDVTRFVPGIPGLVLFDDHAAELVHKFINRYPDKDFVIHCDAGVSRSMAVGVFLRDARSADLEIVSNQPTNPTQVANMFANALVLRKLKERLWQEQLRKGESRGSQ